MFVDMLRGADFPITVSETLDALSAIRVVGIDHAAFHDGLAATLLKDEADRPSFDAIFDRCFPLVGKRRGSGHHHQSAGDAGVTGIGPTRSSPVLSARPHTEQVRPQSRDQQHGQTFRERGKELERPSSGNRRLRDLPFKDMSPTDIEECEALMSNLAQRFRAYQSRRQRAARRGCLDIRRTIRRSINRGGVPIEPVFRRRQPHNPNLIALCDSSHSVATATRFLIGLLSPAQQFFRQVRLFAYVDHPIESTIESAALVPHEPLDLYARSDFGRVLVTFWEHHEPLLTRNTVVLVLSDARNNRRPPRPEILGRIRGAVRCLVWLNPEPRVRWNTGDSVMHTYQRHCDTVLAASTIRELYGALRHSFTNR